MNTSLRYTNGEEINEEAYLSARFMIFELPRFFEKFLHRYQYIWNESLKLSETLDNAMCFKVTGSNGKGSCTNMLSSILTKMNINNASFTSPHFLRINERFKINGIPILDKDFNEGIKWFKSIADKYEGYNNIDGFMCYDAILAVYTYLINKYDIKYMVNEVARGGRYDSVRFFNGKITLLTSLDLEHTDILGDTLLEVAYHKADLCDTNGILVVGFVPRYILNELHIYCSFRNITVISVEDSVDIQSHRYCYDGMYIDAVVLGREFKNLKVGLCGEFQVKNAMTVVTAMLLAKKYYFNDLEEEDLIKAIYDGLPYTKNRGRMERISINLSKEQNWYQDYLNYYGADDQSTDYYNLKLNNQTEKPKDNPDECDVTVYIDAGHTPCAMISIVQSIPYIFNGDIILCFVMQSEYDIADMLDPFLTLSQIKHICFSKKGLIVDSLLEDVIAYYKKNKTVSYSIFDDLTDLTNGMIDIAVDNKCDILVTGSFYCTCSIQSILLRYPKVLVYNSI